jgi:IS605 OrfB family transposase
MRGKLKRLRAGFELSPSLIVKGAKVALACPAETAKTAFIPNKHIHRVVSVDVGINTAATLAVLDRTGTVIARRFLTCGKHNDQRDVLSARVADRQKRSHGGLGRRLGAGFCAGLYRRIASVSLQAARTLSSAILAFAREHGARVVVIEQLKGYRPKGQGRVQRQRFHRFQHRMMVRYLAFGAEEAGLRLLEIAPRGTSRYAYDGSGKVERSRENAAHCRFASGKRYNADLNAAYNIAARGLAVILNIKKPVLDAGAGTGKSSGPAVRMPLVLADVWAFTARANAAAH